jgi:hypothetical protein
MSNLSDLLPAGAGAKSATFTASGTLATGTTVALQSDGTVKAISATGTSYTETLGSDTSIANVNSSQFSAAYHVAGDKIIVGYRNVTDVNGYYVVGTISGSTITFTSPISFSATNTTDVNVTYHEAAQVVVFSYKNGFNDGVARAASLSGTTLTFGSEVAFTTNNTDYTTATYDSDQERIVVCYSDSNNSDYLTGVALSVSGTAITAGTPVVLESQFAAYISVEYHRANTVHVVAYKNQTSGDMRGRGFTVSGTTVTNGNQTLIANGDARPGSPRGLTYYPEIEKLLLVYQDPTNDYGRIIPLNATTSGGGTVTKGTEEYFTSAAITDAENSLAIEPFTAASKLVITYKNSGDSFLVSVSVDASENITVDTPITLQSGSGGSEQQTLGYDSVAAQMVVAYADKTNSNYATANLYNPAYSATNSADFVGITDEAIANAATGSVVVEGGVITNSQLLPPTYTLSAGSETVYEAAESYENSIVYDPDNGKVIIAYRDGGNSSYGTVIVGTVSGSSISFGSPVVFEAASSSYPSIAYDTTNDKIAIAFTDGGNSNFGTGIVGTVSGTSVTFGSATVFESDTTVDIVSTFDANAGKIVVAYRDIGNSNYGTAVVGTISGTSISYGTPVVFESATSTAISIAYDTNAQKVVISYKDGGNSDYGTSIVGTVSGTSISFGSAVVYEAAGINYSAITYDSTAQKVVIAYNDNGNSGAGTAIVGTVSGTSISFGSPLVVQTNSAFFGLAYDSNADRTVMASANLGSSNRGEMFNLKMTGDTLSTEGSSVVFNAGGTANIFLTYDATAQKVVCAYRDTDNTNYGTSVVATLTESYPSMTTGSTYYVQDDGSLSTTSSSVTAGKALSSTTLLLKG